MEVLERINIQQIRELKPKTIWYSANTCWWTHDPMHLSTTGGKYNLPCDPRGAVLFMTDDVEGFLRAAEDNVTHYGKHGIRAFLAAHHLNCVHSLILERPWCSTNWQDYNDAIDRLDWRKQLVRGENDDQI